MSIYSTDEFLKLLDENKAKSRESLLTCKEERLDSLLNEKKKDLENILGLKILKSIEATKELTLAETEKKEGYTLNKYDFTFLPKLKVPVWVLTPDNPCGGNVLYCHGHDSYGAKGSFTKYSEEMPYHKYLPIELVSRGYTVVIPELVGFGEVIKEGHNPDSEKGCYANSTHLLMNGISIAGIRIFEAQKVIDIMKQQWDMDNIAVFGVSGGGLVAGFLTAVDDRLNAVAVSSYSNTFEKSILSMHHCVDNYIPNILSIGEMPEVLSLAVGTPFLLSNGRADRIFPVSGTNKAIKEISDIYKRFGCEDKFSSEVFDGIHEVNLGDVFDFFKKYTTV